MTCRVWKRPSKEIVVGDRYGQIVPLSCAVVVGRTDVFSLRRLARSRRRPFSCHLFASDGSCGDRAPDVSISPWCPDTPTPTGVLFQLNPPATDAGRPWTRLDAVGSFVVWSLGRSRTALCGELWTSYATAWVVGWDRIVGWRGWSFGQ